MVAPSFDFFGGAAVVFVKLANHLQHYGHEITVLTHNLSGDVISLLDVKKIIYSSSRPCGYLLKVFFITSKLYKIQHDFDVINIHNFPAVLGLIFSKKPALWMCNEPPSVELRYKTRAGFKKIIVSFLLIIDKFIVHRKVNKIVVADFFNKKRIESEYGKDSQVIPYGIDTEFYKYQNKPKDEFVILQVGVITPEKNQLETLKAFKSISDSIKNARLVFAGRPEESYYKVVLKEANDLGLFEKVIFLENQTPDSIKDLYYKSSLLIHPVKSQGGWLSAFEAISCGLPVITSEEFTAKDVISENSLAIVTEDYAQAIMEIWRNPIPNLELQRRSKWVKDNLSWDKFCNDFMSSLRNVGSFYKENP